MVLRILAIGLYCFALLSGLLAFGAAPRDACYRLFLTMALACLVAAWAFPVEHLFRKRFLPLLVAGAFLFVQIPLKPPVERYGYVFLGLGWLALTFTLLITRARPGHARFLSLFLVALGLFDAFYGLVQALGGMDSDVANVDRNMLTMASGTFVNRNHFAGLLNMTIPVALGGLYATFPRRGDKLRSEGYAWAWIILLVTAFMGLAILLSWSRGGALSLIASLIFLSILMLLKRRRKENRKHLSAGAAWVLLLTTVVLGMWVGIDTLIDRFGSARDDSTERLLVYRDSVRMIADHPLVGVGPKMYQYYFKPPVDVSQDCRWTHAHNDYLESAVEYGLPLALLFWGFVLWRLWGAGRDFLAMKDLWSEGIALGCAGAIFSILLHSLADFNLQIPINWVIFCMVLGLAWGRTPVQPVFGRGWKILVVAGLGVLLIATGWSVIKESIAMQIADNRTIPAYEEALEWVPDHPVFHFGLGVLYRDDIDQDLLKAGEHLEAATRLNPREWVYWQELGRYYELVGDRQKAERAMKTCLEVMPLYASERWRLGNFYLQDGRVAEAVPEIKQAVELNPAYRQATLMVFWKGGLEEQELDRVWPADRESELMRTRFLVQVSAPVEAIDRQWAHAVKAARPEGITLEEAAFYFNHLAHRKDFDALRNQWIEINRLAGRSDPDFEKQTNLVWNGSFRLPIEGLLDWRIPTSEAYETGVTDGSFRIDFKGSGNINFRAGQLVIIPRPGRYALSVKSRSEDITTEQGPYFQVVDPATGKVLGQTEPMIGSKSPGEQVVPFEIPEGTRTVSVELRRNPSKRIDNKIRGTLWLDHVVLRREDRG